jgi:hypothetical protein
MTATRAINQDTEYDEGPAEALVTQYLPGAPQNMLHTNPGLCAAALEASVGLTGIADQAALLLRRYSRQLSGPEPLPEAAKQELGVLLALMLALRQHFGCLMKEVIRLSPS